MPDKIETIEGIGDKYGAKLKAKGILTADDLLARAATPGDRKKLAEELEIAEGHILKWANHADLMRVNGIGPQYAELLEAAGVDTVKELRTRNAENLTKKMDEVNGERRITSGAPHHKVVARWIEEAKTMEPKLSY